MATVSKVSPMRIGKCPHGNPIGACPICSGMGGGSGKKADFSAKPGEMSYAQCLAIGNMLKAQKQRRLDAKNDFMQMQQHIAAFYKHMNNMLEKIQMILVHSFNKLPDGVKTVIKNVVNNLVMPTLNSLKNVFNNIKNIVNNTFQQIKGMLKEACDRFVGIMGELKNFFEKQIVEKFNEMKTKLFKLFGFANANSNQEHEQQKVSKEEKLLNELNKIKDWVKKLFNNNKKKKGRNKNGKQRSQHKH
ncbi:MAG: hypothetical protein BHW64_00425 [Candidatus Melainabacteria bacterium LEY3_CP_29_8]|nr:MAG: hypothetical protein BHW64_00425 [Candidatus Melainabacteria bacterium LEY3_CP_29_8]